MGLQAACKYIVAVYIWLFVETGGHFNTMGSSY